MSRRFLFGMGGLWGAAAVFAGSSPVAVSPGDPSELALIESRCPTFSWGAAPAADGYELVVYRLEGDDEEAVPVVRERFAGSVSSWTPSLRRCLERGGRYAWSVRTSGVKRSSQWSSPLLFEVAHGPSLAQIERAWDVIRQHAALLSIEAGTSTTLAGSAGAETPAAGPTPEETEPDATGGSVHPSALPLGFKVGLQSKLDDTGTGTVGVQGTSQSVVQASVGVLGESLAPEGLVAGVKGTAESPFGWAGYFQSYSTLSVTPPGLAAGLFAGGGLPAGSPPRLSADLVLGGLDLFGIVLDDAGTIFSDPRYPSSDLFLFSNNHAHLHLNLDQGTEGEGSWFKIFDGLTEVFKVSHSGDAYVKNNSYVSGDSFVTGDSVFTGGLTVNGALGGSLVDAADIAGAVEAALLEHEQDHHFKLVFVTSTFYTGNLGGLAGADAKCQARAAAAGLVGVFKAWLGDSLVTVDSVSRGFTRSTSPYLLPDGTKVADDWQDLVSCSPGPGCLDNRIGTNEFGTALPGTPDQPVWTGASTSGGLPGPNPQYCSGWTYDTDNNKGGWSGDATKQDAGWTGLHGNRWCTDTLRLYCFQQ